MTWPKEIYVATRILGVYHTDDWDGPGTQPTWHTVNDGLPATDCREFWLDPFDPEGRQYVMLEASRTLYRRTGGGNWESILTEAEAAALLPVSPLHSIGGFCIDPATEGRLWVSVGGGTTGDRRAYGLYSDDYGGSWSLSGIAYSHYWYLYGVGTIRAHANYVYIGLSGWAGGSRTILYSSDGGASWSHTSINGINTLPPMELNPSTPSLIYSAEYYNDTLLTVSGDDGAITNLRNGLGCGYWRMWYDPDDSDHQRLVKGGRLYVTNDAWASNNLPSSVSPLLERQAPHWEGQGADEIIVELSLGNSDHVIGYLEGEDDTTASGIAGLSPGTSPYTNSIPETCGTCARKGIQAVGRLITRNVYTYDVEFEAEPGTGGVQSFGVAFDRGATTGVHASDVEMEA